MLKVAFFSAQAYDNAIFSSLRLEQKSVDETPSSTIDFTFFPHPLNAQTAITCKGFDAVCVFVNDDLSAPTLATLANLKVKSCLGPRLFMVSDYIWTKIEISLKNRLNVRA